MLPEDIGVVTGGGRRNERYQYIEYEMQLARRTEISVNKINLHLALLEVWLGMAEALCLSSWPCYTSPGLYGMSAGGRSTDDASKPFIM